MTAVEERIAVVGVGLMVAGETGSVVVSTPVAVPPVEAGFEFEMVVGLLEKQIFTRNQ